MLLITHIIVAITSLIFTTALLFQPSKRGLIVGYSLVGFTLASGTYLVVSTHSSILQGCMTGLIYLAFASVGLAVAQFKVATAKS